MKSESTGKKARSTGVGESKIFVSNEPAEARRVDECHVCGVKVADLPPQLQLAITYDRTDEGVAERAQLEAKLREQHKLPSIQLGMDALDKRQGFRGADGLLHGTLPDQLRAGMSHDESDDAMVEAERKYLQPGQAAGWINEECVRQLGMRGYVPVKDENGDQVKIGDVFMGSMPIEKQAARYQRRADLVKAKTNEINDQIQEQTAKNAAAAGLRVNSATLPDGRPVGLQSQTGSIFDLNETR